MKHPLRLQNKWGGKRYNSFNRVLRETFHARVYKIGLRMDFTCPNRDGKVAVGGCTYCNNASHTPPGFHPGMSVTEQMEQGAIALLADFLELFAPEMVIHRLTGETYRQITVAPDWSVNKIGLANAINDYLEYRDSWQGKKYVEGAVSRTQPANEYQREGIGL